MWFETLGFVAIGMNIRLTEMLKNVKALRFFFFSSRRRHTRWPRDWSSDVCSSDLYYRPLGSADVRALIDGGFQAFNAGRLSERSEERRVGKECRSRWSPYH